MKKKKHSHIFDGILAIVLVIAGILYFVAPLVSAKRPAQEQTQLTSGTAYELPRLVSDQPEQLIQHLGYTVSYNHDWLVPNWVAYELTDFEAAGDLPRSNNFAPDPLVHGDPVVTYDYKNSGYDRGHMAPAGDMKWSEQAMRESFYMTNICPQNHNNNAGDWKSLEELARDWAHQYGNIYITCGPIVEPNHATIGLNHVIAVPAAFYKVFLRQTRSGWSTIGFVMPNQAGSRPLMTYMMTVDEIENLTGIDFFYNLPDDIEEQVESDINLSDWSFKR